MTVSADPAPSSTPSTTRRNPTPRAIEAATRRGVELLLGEQRPDGSFECEIDVGPVAIACQIIVEDFTGTLTPASAKPAIAALRRWQREDGSFPAWIHALQGAVTTTALAAAALRRAGVAPTDPAVVRAEAWARAHGGDEEVVRAFVETGEASAIYLVAAGALPPDVLPAIPMAVVLTPLLERLVDGRVHAGNLLAMFSILAVAHHCTAAQAPRRRGWFRSAVTAAMRELERHRAVDYLTKWQNPDGSFNQAVFPTQLMALGLAALGVAANEAPLAATLRWLDERKSVGRRTRIQAIPNDVWSTAMVGLALQTSDEPGAVAGLQRAVSHLRAEQLREPQPRANQRKRGAKRTGGWAFQSGNPTMPDCDDTGLVLALLGTTTAKEASRESFAAVDDGVAWLRDMQNPDGGWPAYVWNLRGKEPGPMFNGERLMPDLRDAKAAVSMFLEPPPEMGDPATEGVTARVLWGLGACGVGRDDPAVCRAIEFLRAQQCPSGAFWDRWMTCYLPGTATVLIGLHAVGEDLDSDYVQRALGWMMSCQNDDGGFGEEPAAFSDPEAAGRGPSMPGVTGFVLLAALRAGHPVDATVRRAVRYLVRTQRSDGSWDGKGWVNPYVPPDTFYEYTLANTCMPVMALAEYTAACGR